MGTLDKHWSSSTLWKLTLAFLCYSVALAAMGFTFAESSETTGTAHPFTFSIVVLIAITVALVVTCGVTEAAAAIQRSLVMKPVIESLVESGMSYDDAGSVAYDMTLVASVYEGLFDDVDNTAAGLPINTSRGYQIEFILNKSDYSYAVIQVPSW